MMVMRQDIAMSDRGIWTASSYDGAGDSDSHSLIMKMFPLPFCFCPGCFPEVETVLSVAVAVAWIPGSPTVTSY